MKRVLLREEIGQKTERDKYYVTTWESEISCPIHEQGYIERVITPDVSS